MWELCVLTWNWPYHILECMKTCFSSQLLGMWIIIFLELEIYLNHCVWDYGQIIFHELEIYINPCVWECGRIIFPKLAIDLNPCVWECG